MQRTNFEEYLGYEVVGWNGRYAKYGVIQKYSFKDEYFIYDGEYVLEEPISFYLITDLFGEKNLTP